MAGFLSALVQYRKLLLMILVLGIGGTHLAGFQMSVINYTSPFIQKFINETWMERYGSALHKETLTLFWSFIVSAYCVGGMIGCLCSGYLTAKYGKKKCLLINDVVLIIATLNTGFSRRAKSFEMILIGRFLEGICAAMKQLWGEDNYLTEFDDMMKEKAVTKGTKIMNVIEVLKEPSITFYTSEIFQTANLHESIIPYVALGVAVCELISIIFCSSIIDRFGRRRLLWGGYLLMALVLVLLETSLLLSDRFLWMRYCNVILIFLFIIAYGIGPAGAVSSVMNEIFTLSARSSAYVIGGMIIWLGLTFTGMIFPFAVVCNLIQIFSLTFSFQTVFPGWSGQKMALGPFCFLIFIAVLVVSSVLIYLFVPETKGKSTFEITEEFRTRRFKKKRHQIGEKNMSEEKTYCTKL
ncbi:hypothetical protein ASZ78_008760 [Callipepla squamata]|uniref:Major facilitator superfamily (MFS) profile domain-containing protein n=1 Tax=Callipepla squamata TaxID=9009 RepID=A0A226NAS7_CALSU|nr:hypothetical protein ASZ78_008760 [Callipepla squamata]